MDYFEQNGKSYIEQIRKFKPTDKVHADIVNAVIENLVNNDAFLKAILAEKVNNAGDTMTGELEVLSSTPNVKNISKALPVFTGNFQDESLTDFFLNHRSFIGSVFSDDIWRSIISNSIFASDGKHYGFYLWNKMQNADEGLYWKYFDGEKISGDRKFLDSENLGNYALPKTGGIVTGRTAFEQGTSVITLSGGAGTSGYMHVCQIKIISAYVNMPICMRIIQRGGKFGELIITFNNYTNADPPLGRFAKQGNIDAYIVKSATGTWDVYLKKDEAYDSIEIAQLLWGQYSQSIQITWKDATVTSLPSGYREAILDTYTTNIKGNADTATKLSNPRQIALSGAVTGEVNFDGSSNVIIETKRREANIYKETDANQVWFKFADITVGNPYIDHSITFLVSAGYADASQGVGVLTAHFRTSGGTPIVENRELVWNFANNTINPDDFVLAYNGTNSPVKVELWAKLDGNYKGYCFEVLAEKNRTSSDNAFTLYKTSQGTNAITSGYTQVKSYFAHLKNSAEFARCDIDGHVISANYFGARSTWIGNTTDWNTITTPGCYKVQVAPKWGDATIYHSPNAFLSNLYSYGLLFVFTPYNDDEKRTIQIYIPHAFSWKSTYRAVYRYKNGDDWGSWLPLQGTDRQGSDIVDTYQTKLMSDMSGGYHTNLDEVCVSSDGAYTIEEILKGHDKAIGTASKEIEKSKKTPIKTAYGTLNFLTSSTSVMVYKGAGANIECEFASSILFNDKTVLNIDINVPFANPSLDMDFIYNITGHSISMTNNKLIIYLNVFNNGASSAVVNSGKIPVQVTYIKDADIA